MARSHRIGLDVGTVRIKAAQCDRRGRPTRLANFPRLRPGEPVDHDEALHIAEVLLRQDFRPGPIVLANPADHVRIEELEIPPIKDRAALDRVVGSEIARVTHWAPGTFEQAWWSIPSPPQRASGAALAVASTHANCEALIEIFSLAGFDVEALDLRPAATARACNTAADSAGAKCAVDVGWSASTLSVWIESELVYVRALPGSCMKSVADAMGINGENAPAVLERLRLATEDNPWGAPSLVKSYRAEVRNAGASLAAELERSYTYIARRFSIDDAIPTFVAGGGANLPHLLESIRGSLGLTALRATPGTLYQGVNAQSRWMDDSSLVTACGLMMWNGAGS